MISKGRWETRLTANSLERMNIPYHIVVEPQERGLYASVIDPAKVLVLPFSNLGEGSIPARNWVWDHAAATGAHRHWIMDDNIDGFYRLNRNIKTPCFSGAIFRAAEDFVDRYENVAIAGFHYFMFASRKTWRPPFTINSRIYSCILLRNDIPYRWRGRYNEDTDLSIRVLLDGWVTVLFSAFLSRKTTTMTMKGGNTDKLYGGGEGTTAGESRFQMAQALVEQFPELAKMGLIKVTTKWGRNQHHVDYSVFRNELVRRPDVIVPDGPDEYGMELIKDGPPDVSRS